MINPLLPNYSDLPGRRGDCFQHDPGMSDQGLCEVSILTPYYNTQEFFVETAVSIFNQSLKSFEWIIVDDGSTDQASLNRLRQISDSDARIRLVTQHNCGPAAARNNAFQHSRGKYLCLLDSDDMIEPTYVEKCVWFLESNHEFEFCNAWTVAFGDREFLWREGFGRGEEFLHSNFVPPIAVIRREAFEKCSGFEDAIVDGHEDWDFWLGMAKKGCWGYTLPEFLQWSRKRSDGREKIFMSSGHSHAEFEEYIQKKYRELVGNFPSPQCRLSQPCEVIKKGGVLKNPLSKPSNARSILFVVPWLTMGGADKFNLDLLQQLTHCGWKVTIVTTLNGDNSWVPFFSEYTPDIFILHKFLRLVDYPSFIEYVINSRQVDVVFVSNSEMGYSLLPYLRAHCPKTTFIDFCHIEEEYWKNGGYPRMAIEHQDLLDLNIVSSCHLKEWMVERGADPTRIEINYINVDPVCWRPVASRRFQVRQELDVASDLPVLLYVGRIVAQKQPRVFAQTLLKLSQTGIPFVALVAGDGPDLAWLRGFVQQHQLDHFIRLLGAVPNERVKDLMWASDLFFLPSLWEGIALSMYEAMASGLAVVGADVGGQKELVTPECGVLIARSSESAESSQYALVLEELLTNPDRIKSMGKNGRQRIENFFRLDQMSLRMVQLLEKALCLHYDQPRPTVNIGIGQVCAWKAIEQVRVNEVADRLWWEQEQGKVPIVSWRTNVFFALRRVLLPLFHKALDCRMTWLIPIKDKLKLALLRGAS